MKAELNAIDGLEDLECEQFELLILNLDLPGLCGEEALARVKTLSNFPDLSILVVSTDAHVRQRLLESGEQADAVLSKPFILGACRKESRYKKRRSDCTVIRNASALSPETIQPMGMRDLDHFLSRRFNCSIGTGRLDSYRFSLAIA